MRLPIVVLAGGLATRLYPITKKIPKSLIPINNIPFVLYQLRLFQRNGISHIHFCLGHMGEMVIETIEKSSFNKDLNITYSFDGDKLLGTAGAIKNTLSKLPEIFFVTYGDSYLDVDYRSIESMFLNTVNNDCGLMTVYKNFDNYDASNVIYENNKILLYSKKQSNLKMTYIDYGLSILRKSHFNFYPENVNLDLSEILENLSSRQMLVGYEIFNRFYEIGSLKGIDDLSNFLKKTI